MRNKYSNEHNKDKNPKWQEADQLANYKRSLEVELGATENNISWWSEQDLNAIPTDFRFGAYKHLATLPPQRSLCKVIPMPPRELTN